MNMPIYNILYSITIHRYSQYLEKRTGYSFISVLDIIFGLK